MHFISNDGEKQTATSRPSLSFMLCKVERADGAVTLKSFHRLAPFEVTSAFRDQGPEYSKIIQSPLARPP